MLVQSAADVRSSSAADVFFETLHVGGGGGGGLKASDSTPVFSSSFQKSHRLQHAGQCRDDAKSKYDSA